MNIKRILLAALVASLGLALAWPAGALAGQPAAANLLPAVAGVQLTAVQDGVFAAPGGQAKLQITIRNTGSSGADTIDLTAVSAWPVTFYAADGTTLLTDHNANSKVDTGALPAAAIFTATVSAQVPPTATVGSSLVMTITGHSSINIGTTASVALQAAVPAPFAQAFSDRSDGALRLLLARPMDQNIIKVGADHALDFALSSDMAVAETPAGGFAYAWNGDGAIYYALLDKAGNIIRPATALFIPEGGHCVLQPAMPECANSPVIAVTPDGHIGVAWASRNSPDNTQPIVSAVRLAVLNQDGDLIPAVTTIDSGATWGGPIPGNALVSSPRLTATPNNHFVMGWVRSAYNGPNSGCPYSVGNYLLAASTTGAVLSGPARLTIACDGQTVSLFGLSALSANRVLVTDADSVNGLGYAVVDSAIAPVKDQTSLGVTGPSLVVTPLSGGRTALAWSHAGAVQFAELDAAYNLVAGPTTLASPTGVPTATSYYPSGTPDSLSITYDTQNHAILTWAESNLHLYYALVDGAGAVITPPTIFYTAVAGSPTFAESGFVGQGNTSYHFVAPAGVDETVTVEPATAFAAPGGDVDFRVRVTNYGLSLATGLQLTATVDGGLTYLGDTSGLTATVLGSTVAWHLPQQPYAASQAFTLTLSVPLTATLGTHYLSGLTVSADQPDANPVDNAFSALVIAAYQVFLPIIPKD